MSGGIEVYTATGKLSTKSSDWTTVIIGTIEITGTDGEIIVPKNAYQHIWYIIRQIKTEEVSSNLAGRRIPIFRITETDSEAKLVWQYNNNFYFYNMAPKLTVTILYGLTSG